MAEASLAALTAPKAGYERLLLLNGYFDNQKLCDIIHGSKELDSSVKDRVPIGQPGQNIATRFYKADWSKAERLLRFAKPTLEQTVVDLVKQLTVIDSASKAKVNGVKSNVLKLTTSEV
jgi:hypothetical protein